MFTGALDELANAGTITAAQEKAVLEALSAAMPQPGGAPGELRMTAAPSCDARAPGPSQTLHSRFTAGPR